ncbi:hypothetical protein AUK22_08415 [bacterium CG2_30_54_10]|nr:MAG: hypothetical protein AUK22_08415 [bacterium CG2_30_54_10]
MAVRWHLTTLRSNPQFPLNFPSIFDLFLPIIPLGNRKLICKEHSEAIMKLGKEEAYYILTNLDQFVSHFETSTQRKVTSGALQIIQEILTEASFPMGAGSEHIH